MTKTTHAILLVSSLLHAGCDPGSKVKDGAMGGSTSSIRTSVGTGGNGAGGASAENSDTAAGGVTGTSDPSIDGTCGDHTGFWVDGRFLRDRCCEKVILRGVNEMVTWSANRDGTPYFAEIAKTGANVVRIVWTTKDSASGLDTAIKNALAEQLIPMPELHDATGDMSKLASCVDYWVNPEVVAVLQKYQDRLLINIANEVGNGSVSKADWTAAYRTAISRMREAGIHVPLIIDAPTWGQDIDMLQSAGPELIAADADKNVMFSVHLWWNDPEGTRITSELNQSAKMNLPLIVGEFAQHNFSGCSSQGLAYKTLLSLSKTLEIGWLAWSWGGVKNQDCADDQPFDMTTDGTFAGLTGWGLDVAVTDPNGIQQTSIRSRTLNAESCE